MAYDTPFGRTIEGKELSWKKVMRDGVSSAHRQGKGFGAIGAAYSVSECLLESVSNPSGRMSPGVAPFVPFKPANMTSPSVRPQYRGKKDISTACGGGFLAGALLARNHGTRSMIWGGATFSAFSWAIEHFWIQRPPADDDHGFFVC